MSHLRQTMISGDIQAIVQAAGFEAEGTADFSHRDGRTGGLRYLLRRLSLLGLTKSDEEQLRELGRLTFHDLDTTEVANQITNDASASPLAVAIAGIVRSSRAQRKKWVMLGAVSGAYLGVSGPATDNEKLMGILGAIGGAVAASTIEVFQSTEHLRSEEGFLGSRPSRGEQAPT